MRPYDETMDEVSQRLGTVLYHQRLSGSMSGGVHGVNHVAGALAYAYDRDAKDVCDELVRKMEAYEEYLMDEYQA